MIIESIDKHLERFERARNDPALRELATMLHHVFCDRCSRANCMWKLENDPEYRHMPSSGKGPWWGSAHSNWLIRASKFAEESDVEPWKLTRILVDFNKIFAPFTRNK